MLISCPKCSARYKVDDVTSEDVLECHSCGSKFSIEEQANEPDDTVASEKDTLSAEKYLDNSPIQERISGNRPTQSETNQNSDQQTDSVAEITIEELETTNQEDTENNVPAPQRRAGRIWPWLFLVLLAIAGSGFWFNKDAWLDNVWVRSSLANLGMPILVRDKDWNIISDSVHATWVERDNGSRVMVIEGRLANLLPRPVPLPVIRVRYFSAEDPSQPVHALDAYITEPPLLDNIRKTPYQSPPLDALEVIEFGERDFVLVIEDAPSKAGDFELKPIARQPGA